jgi:hypothetical protein
MKDRAKRRRSYPSYVSEEEWSLVVKKYGGQTRICAAAAPLGRGTQLRMDAFLTPSRSPGVAADERPLERSMSRAQRMNKKSSKHQRMLTAFAFRNEVMAKPLFATAT